MTERGPALGGERALRPVPTGFLLGLLLIPASLGISAISVALAPLAADLGLSDAEAVWTLAGYVLVHAIGLAILGRLGDIRGIAPVLRVALVLLVVGSVLAATATSLGALVAGRMIQGLGAAGMPVAVFSIIGLRFSGAPQVMALAMVTAMLSVVSGAGSLVGGALTDLLSWRAVVGLPLLSLLAAPWVIRLAPAAAARGQRIDLVGALLLTLWATALVLLLEAPSIALPATLLVGLAVAVAVTSALLLRRIRAVPAGFLPAAVVGSRRFVLGALASASIYSVYIALLFAAPLLLLRDHDWSATTVGLVLLPAALIGAVSARIVARLVLRFDPFRVSAGLAAASAFGMALTGATDGSPVGTTLGLAFVLTGFIASQGALLAHVPLAVAPQVRSVATGIFQLTALIGGALGSAAVAGLATPLGLGGAVASLAVIPMLGAVLALRAGAAPATVRHPPPVPVPDPG